MPLMSKPSKLTPTSIWPGEMQLIRTPVPSRIVRDPAIQGFDSQAFENCNSRLDHAKRSVRAHCVAWTPAAYQSTSISLLLLQVPSWESLTTVSTSHAADHNDASILLVLGSCIWVMSFCSKFCHGWWGVLKGEEGRHAICLEAFLKMRRCGRVYRGRS